MSEAIGSTDFEFEEGNYVDFIGIEEQASAEIQEILESYAEAILTLAQELCPVKTGRLRDSLYSVTLEDGVAIESDCEYFGIVEAQQGFVAMAYSAYEDMLLQEIDAAMMNSAEAAD